MLLAMGSPGGGEKAEELCRSEEKELFWRYTPRKGCLGGVRRCDNGIVFRATLVSPIDRYMKSGNKSTRELASL